jgi:predicted ferric reductase
MVASVAVSWFAFSGAQGENGSVQLALFIGATSIMLMTWSFILSYRSRMLESVFGGLDRMYRVHRWAGSLAVVAMWLHTSFESEVEDGIPGASESVADAARGLAGAGLAPAGVNRRLT